MLKYNFFVKNSEGKGDSKGKKTPKKPLKILDEDDEDLSALRDPSEKVSKPLTEQDKKNLLSIIHRGAMLSFTPQIHSQGGDLCNRPIPSNMK